MKNIADNVAKGVLKRIQNDLDLDNIDTTQAWKIFSSPLEAIKSINPNLGLTKAEADSIQKLNAAVKSALKKKVNGRCAYCKRVMGQHGMSWHIEHIFSKAKNRSKTFSMSNLTYACIDCNLTKNNSVDQKNEPFDIINPNAPSFSYSHHIEFLQISTASFHLLKYRPRSPQGTSTYGKLNFEALENVELMMSLNEPFHSLALRIDQRLNELKDEDNAIKTLLLQLKAGLAV